MEQDKKTSLLVAYGRTLGLSTAAMEKISADAAIANDTAENDSAVESILAVAGGCDPKILWLGAVLYGFVLDTFDVQTYEPE